MGEIAAAIERERSGVADAERHLRDLQTRLDTIGKVSQRCGHQSVLGLLYWTVAAPCPCKGGFDGGKVCMHYSRSHLDTAVKMSCLSASSWRSSPAERSLRSLPYIMRLLSKCEREIWITEVTTASLGF